MHELTPELDVNNEKPLYAQLYMYIRSEIETDRLPHGSKLPSKRKLAKHLHISQNTVETAYGQLMAEGYIEGIARKGFFVCKLEKPLIESGNRNPTIPYVEEKKIQNIPFDYDFTQTGVDPDSFPFEKYRKITNRLLRSENVTLLTIGHPQGDYELREEISTYLYESRGVKCLPSQIVIGAGTQTLIHRLLQVLPSDVIAVENPGYHLKTVLFEKGEKLVEPIPLDEEGLEMSSLEKSKANAVFVTPSHQFPLGMTMPISKRMQLLSWAEEKPDRFIIEDDYDSEFRYSSKPIPALQGLDHAGKVVYMGTFSKALLPAIRVAYMVLPIPLIEIYQNDLFFLAQTVSRIDQHILIHMMKEGLWKRHIHKMRVVYQKKRDVLVSAVSTYFPDSVELIGEDSGLHVLVRVNNGMTEQELIEKAEAVSVNVYPVSAYGQSDGKTILLGFAILSCEEIEQAIRLLSSAWFRSR